MPFFKTSGGTLVMKSNQDFKEKATPSKKDGRKPEGGGRITPKKTGGGGSGGGFTGAAAPSPRTAYHLPVVSCRASMYVEFKGEGYLQIPMNKPVHSSSGLTLEALVKIGALPAEGSGQGAFILGTQSELSSCYILTRCLLEKCILRRKL